MAEFAWERGSPRQEPGSSAPDLLTLRCGGNRARGGSKTGYQPIRGFGLIRNIRF